MASRRRKHEEEHENTERWLVSYADFITLLFAFFVVLYATSAADIKKQEEFQESVKQSFAAGVGFGGSSAFDELNDMRNNAFIKPAFETFPPLGSATQEVEDYVEHKLEKNMTEQERKEMISAVKHDAVGVRIQMAASKIFPPGSSDLTAESAKALDEIGKLLKESNRRVIVEGHTDDQPIRNDKFPSNWELSAARATKIVRYLAAKHKIPGSRLTAVAYGDQKPAVPNSDEESRAKNRRIEILIVTGKSEF